MTNPIPVYIDKHRIVWTRDLPPNGVAMTNEERRRELIEAFNRGQERRQFKKVVYQTGVAQIDWAPWETAEDYLKEKGIA